MAAEGKQRQTQGRQVDAPKRPIATPQHARRRGGRNNPAILMSNPGKQRKAIHAPTTETLAMHTPATPTSEVANPIRRHSVLPVPVTDVQAAFGRGSWTRAEFPLRGSPQSCREARNDELTGTARKHCPKPNPPDGPCPVERLVSLGLRVRTRCNATLANVCGSVGGGSWLSICTRPITPLHCNRLFGLEWAWRKGHHVSLTTPSIGCNSTNVVAVHRCEFMLDTKDFVVDRISGHRHIPNSSSGLQMIGGVYPASRQMSSITPRVDGFAMCRKFQVNRYCSPPTAAMAMCKASRGSVSGMP